MAIETFKIINDKRDLNLNFRYTNILQILQVRITTYCKNSFRYAAPSLWNSLPERFRQWSNFSQFKSLILLWNGKICKCKRCKHLGVSQRGGNKPLVSFLVVQLPQLLLSYVFVRFCVHVLTFQPLSFVACLCFYLYVHIRHCLSICLINCRGLYVALCHLYLYFCNFVCRFNMLLLILFVITKITINFTNVYNNPWCFYPFMNIVCFTLSFTYVFFSFYTPAIFYS